MTISDIAKEAHVDKSTVSIVLNHKPLAKRIAQATKERIFAVAKKLDYQPSIVAKSLTSGKTNTIGLVLGGIGTPYGAAFAEAVLEATEARGQKLLISATKWDQTKELECLNNMIQHQVDGIIFYPGALTEESSIYKKIIKQQFPIVLYDYKLPGISSVLSDLVPGMTEAISLLKANHHNMIGFAYTSNQPEKKLTAFRNAANAAEIEQQTFKGCEEAIANHIAKTHNICNAWILASDEEAQQIMHLLAKQGIRTPEDLAVISIDGTSWGAYNTPALTSIKQDVKSLMKHAVDLILNKKGTTETVSVPTSLIIRDSVSIH